MKGEKRFMLARFDLPANLPQEVSFADLFRLGPAHDPFWSRVRAAQLDLLLRYMPFNIALILTNSVVVLAGLAGMVAPTVLVMWVLMNGMVLSLWAVRTIAARTRGTPQEATPDFLCRILCELGLVGFAWGLLFFVVIPMLDFSLAMLAVAMMMAAVGCTAFTAAIFPLAAAAISVPIVAGTLLGIMMAHWNDAVLIGIVVAGFILILGRSNLMSTSFFLSRLRVQDQLVEQEEMVRLLLNEFDTNGRDWLFEFDGDGRLTFVSKRFSEVAWRPVEELIGMQWTVFLGDPETAGPLIGLVRKGRAFRDCLLKVEIAGETRWWNLSGTPKQDMRGRVIGYRGVGSDVTERQRSAQRIADLATFDTLTGLVNRRIVHKAVEEGLQTPAGVILLFVDLDRFKTVNDTLGHGDGDRLLVEVARRLRAVVDERALVGRLGGDEFAIVVPSGDVDAAIHLGDMVIARLSEPYLLGDTQALIGASIGLAVGPRDGNTVEALMRAADLALYDVKSKGRGSTRCYDRDMHRRAEYRRSLELDLRNAMAGGQLHLAFQPIVDAHEEHIVGFEALMRWDHPVHGEISPAVFIPIAEETGLIENIGRWALDEACRVASGWPADLRLSVNLSPSQFDDPQLAGGVEQTLRRWNIAPSRLELELTESLFLQQQPQTMATLERLRAMGVSIALDDFGTGYASLGYLQKIDFTRIKIDRSFVRAAIVDEGESTAIIQAIVALADQLGMETVAEGAETRAEFEAMRRLGCGQVQGYYFGRPMKAGDVARLLARRAEKPLPLPASGPLSQLADLNIGEDRVAVLPAIMPSGGRCINDMDLS